MEKFADKPSADPVQQKLRLMKKEWNKEISAFIDDLIHYKKLTNGQPNKFFKERSSIKEPIPADPSTILGSLANDFQQLAQRGNAIINFQIEYSKTRKKKQISGTDSLSQKLSEFEYQLSVEASSPISRFFTRLLNPAIGGSEAARMKRYRMSLLDTAAKLYWDLDKYQAEIVKSSQDSILTSQKLLHDKVWFDWNVIYRGLQTYKNNLLKNNEMVAKPNSESQSNVPPQTEITPPQSVTEPINSDIDEKNTQEIERVAQHIIQKWVGKTIHQLSPFDRTSGYRLDLYKMAEEVRELLNKMMDSLEKGMDIETLTNLAKDINHKILELKTMTRALYSFTTKKDAR